MIDKTKYDMVVTAAGRVNIIGEHIDYCGGKVFPAALSLKNTVYVRPNGTNQINIAWTTLPDTVSLDIDKLESYKTLPYGNYQAGSALMWQRAGHKLVGCDMLQDCTVPFGSGLSSSAAIEVSTIAALATVAGEKFDNVQVAQLAQKAEIEFAGVNCGIMDHYASACGKKDYAMLLDCKTLKCEYVPFRLGEYSLVIINCNRPHNLIESKYNERRSETEEALKTLQEALPVTCLADVTEKDFEQYAHLLHGKVRYRAKHVIEECTRVRLAADAMKEGNIPLLGDLLNGSHDSLRYLYEVSCHELDTLVEAARSHPACVGSRMTGGGFGGCTISLVKTAQKQEFEQYVCEKYLQEMGYAASCYEADIDDGITVKKCR
jgi:galactokinase